MMIWQSSSGSGWQSGMSSLVFFCAHHAGEDGRLKNRAFLRGDLTGAEECGEFARKGNDGDGVGGAARDGFIADVDHRGAVLRVEVGEHGGE